MTMKLLVRGGCQGRVRLESLSLDVWLPTTDGKTLINWISDLFSRSTPFAAHTSLGQSSDVFSRLSREVIRGIASFLTPAELGVLGTWAPESNWRESK